MIKFLLTPVVLMLLASSSLASEASCEAKAAEKKLAGAAQTSFIKKCEKDAKASIAKVECEAKAAEKKLFGAAKNSFTKKCIADAGQ
jgi:hypothetical protein